MDSIIVSRSKKPINEADVIYMIMTDRFYDGEPENNGKLGEEYRPGDLNFRQGGDWKGIQEKIPFLKNMGITALWISPPQENQLLNVTGTQAGYIKGLPTLNHIPNQLLENFIGDLVYSTRNNGSDERMYANQWFDRCWFGMGFHKSFLRYLIEMEESEAFIDAWEDLEEYKQQKELGRYEREDMESLEGYIKRAYEDYKESCGVKQDSFEEDMKIVLGWHAEVEKMEEGTKEKARDKGRCPEEERRIIK